MTETGTGTGQKGLKDESRDCFLFESLTEGQLDWLVAHGTAETHEAGRVVYTQGAPADYFYVLLKGEVQLVTRVDGADVVMNTASQPGAYAGATRAFISASADQSYTSTLRTVARSRLFKLRAEDYSYLLKTWFPMAVHLLDGLFLGMTNTEALLGQREKLIALGSLSAGLADELNNPAAAEVRAAEMLSTRLQDGRRVTTGPQAQRGQTGGDARPAGRGDRAGPGRRPLSPLEAGDLEDQLTEQLEAAGVEEAWAVAPSLVSAGLDEAWLRRVISTTGDAAPDAVRWLATALDIENLVKEIRNSAGRIPSL